MARVLAVDTSSGRGSLALYLNGEVISERSDEPRGHTRQLEPMMQRLLAHAQMGLKDLDGIAYGRGPGSFTGLRITAGFVQGLAWGLDRPVVAVSSLAAMALAADTSGHPLRVAVALDARMGEIYWGCYRTDGQSGLTALADESLLTPEALYLPDNDDGGPWVGAGSGWHYRDAMPEALGTRLAWIDPDAMPDATEVAKLAVKPLVRGETLTAAQVQPVYIRDDVGWQKTGEQ